MFLLYFLLSQKIETGFELITEYTSIKNINLKGSDSDELTYSLRTVKPYLYTTLPDLKTYIKAQSAQIPGMNPAAPVDSSGNLFIENAYLEADILKNEPIAKIKAGKQPLEWGSGVILSDNESGIDAVVGNLMYKNLYLDILTGKKASLNTEPIGFSGLKIKYEDSKSIYEAMYINESGVENSTTPFTKLFYGLRYSPKLKNADVILEYYIQGGTAKGNKEINFNGNAFALTLKGEGKAKAIGWAYAEFKWITASGDNTSTDDIEAFTPSFTKKFSGLIREGAGFIMKANPVDTAPIGDPVNYFSENSNSITQQYPGIQFFSLYISITPFPKLMFHAGWAQANLNSAGTGTPPDKLLGAEYYAGISFKHSKFLEFLFLTGQFQPKEAYGTGTDRLTKSSFITKLKF